MVFSVDLVILDFGFITHTLQYSNVIPLVFHRRLCIHFGYLGQFEGIFQLSLSTPVLNKEYRHCYAAEKYYQYSSSTDDIYRIYLVSPWHRFTKYWQKGLARAFTISLFLILSIHILNWSPIATRFRIGWITNLFSIVIINFWTRLTASRVVMIHSEFWNRIRFDDFVSERYLSLIHVTFGMVCYDICFLWVFEFDVLVVN